MATSRIPGPLCASSLVCIYKSTGLLWGDLNISMTRGNFSRNITDVHCFLVPYRLLRWWWVIVNMPIILTVLRHGWHQPHTSLENYFVWFRTNPSFSHNPTISKFQMFFTLLVAEREFSHTWSSLIAWRRSSWHWSNSSVDGGGPALGPPGPLALAASSFLPAPHLATQQINMGQE